MRIVHLKRHFVKSTAKNSYEVLLRRNTGFAISMRMHLMHTSWGSRVLMYFTLHSLHTKITDWVTFGFQPLYEF